MTSPFPDSHVGPGAKHQALLYTSPDDFASTTAPFVAEGVANGEAAVVITTAENRSALQAVLGELPPSVFFVDDADWYLKPAETVGRWSDFVEGQVARGRRLVRGIGEIASLQQGDAAATREWLFYESVVNPVLAPLALWVLCAYNTSRLPQWVIDVVWETHPSVIHEGKSVLSEHFVPHDHHLQTVNVEGPRDAVAFELGDLLAICSHVEVTARRSGLDEHQVERLVAAASEVAVNAFVHARSRVLVSAWSANDEFVCRIEDEGGGTIDSATGFRPPGERDGWGLWNARQHADSLEIGSGSRGTAVRLAMRRAVNRPSGLVLTHV